MIRLSIRTKLALLLSIFSLLLIVTILLLVQASFDRGFYRYVNEAHLARMQQVVEVVEQVAQQPGQWQRLQRDRRYWLEVLRSAYREPVLLGGDEMPPGMLGKPTGRPDGWKKMPMVWLLDDAQRPVFGRTPPPDHLLRLPLRNGDRVLGYLAWKPLQPHDAGAESVFVKKQQRLLLLIAAITLVVCVLVAWPLSQYLVRPIQRLSQAMQTLMQRRYEVQVPVQSRDELGDLAQDFNAMARTLAEHDRSQRQWLADIAHELRTPLGVLQGELEAMEDGVIALEPAAVSSLQEEVRQLKRLVDDLHQLAVTDLGALRYQFEAVDLVALLQSLGARMTQAAELAGLRLQLELPSSSLWIRADAQRLEQLLMNLMQNSVRYTDRGGVIRVRVFAAPASADSVRLVWEDSAPGVADSDLPCLFERFYRVENSRQRALGGSGLGLAIVANIVSAHGGTVAAEHSELGGLRLSLSWPADQTR